MGKKIGAFILFLVCILVVSTWMGLQNFDVRGFSLSEREIMLSGAGRSTSAIFELNPGYYEFTLHRFQHGERVSEQIFPFGQWGYDDIELIDAIRIENRELLAISMTNANNGAVNLDLHLSGMTFGVIEESGIEENMMLSWESIERRVRLGDAEVPLFYLASVSSKYSGGQLKI